MNRAGVLVTAAVAAFMASGAQARLLPDGGVTPGEVVAELQAKGFKAELKNDGAGDPMIVSATDGTPFRVHFFACTPAKRCATLMFTAGFDEEAGVPMAKVNEWNRRKRFIRAFVDDDQDPYAVLDADLEHGATTEAIANHIDTWTGILPLFKAHFR